MPFIEQNVGGGFAQPTHDPVETDRDFFTEILPDAFRMENTVGSMLSSGGRNMEYDPTYNVQADIDMLDDDLKLHGPSLAKANNKQDFDLIKAQIEDEMAARTRLEQDGGWGVTAMLTAGVLDPINLVPVGGAAVRAYKSGHILRGLSTGAKTGMLSTAASEAILQGTQETRTGVESGINIAAGAMLGGLLGSGAGAIKGMRGKYRTKSMDDLAQGIDADMNLTPEQSAGAAAVRQLPEEKTGRD